MYAKKQKPLKTKEMDANTRTQKAAEVVVATPAQLTTMIRDAVKVELDARLAMPKERKIVSGLKNISKELQISERKLLDMIRTGVLSKSIRKNGSVYLCDVNEAFNEL